VLDGKSVYISILVILHNGMATINPYPANMVNMVS
jgi:hypothetical protein